MALWLRFLTAMTVCFLLLAWLTDAGKAALTLLPILAVYCLLPLVDRAFGPLDVPKWTPPK